MPPPRSTLFPYTTLFRSRWPLGRSRRVRLAPGRQSARRLGARGRADARDVPAPERSEEHTSELQSRENLVCRLLLEKKNSKAWKLCDGSDSRAYTNAPDR